MNRKELENKTLYRTMRVGYVVSFGILLLTLIDRAYVKFSPEPVVDATASSIVCDDGRVYGFELLEFYQSNYGFFTNVQMVHTKHTLEAEVYDNMAKSVCEYSMPYDYNNPRPLPSTPNYTVNEVTKVAGSWTKVFSAWVIYFIGLYVVLNLIRDALNYMFFGKPFTFDWLGGKGKPQHPISKL